MIGEIFVKRLALYHYIILYIYIYLKCRVVVQATDLNYVYNSVCLFQGHREHGHLIEMSSKAPKLLIEAVIIKY